MQRRSRWLSVALVYALLFSPMVAARGKHGRPVHSLWEMPSPETTVQPSEVSIRVGNRLSKPPTLWDEPRRGVTPSPDGVQAAPTVTLADRWPFNADFHEAKRCNIVG